MGRKLDTMMDFSENLTKGFSSAGKWVVKHLPIILLILAILVFAYRSIIHHYLKGLPIGISLATAGLETLKIFTIAIIAGLIAYLIPLLILALLKTLGERRRSETENAEKPEDQTSVTGIVVSETMCDIKIDEELLRKFLDKRAMKMKLWGGDKTVFDEVVSTLKDMLKLHRKGAKGKGEYSDIDFSVWCKSYFKALGLEVPSTIRKHNPKKKIAQLFKYLPKE